MNDHHGNDILKKFNIHKRVNTNIRLETKTLSMIIHLLKEDLHPQCQQYLRPPLLDYLLLLFEAALSFVLIRKKNFTKDVAVEKSQRKAEVIISLHVHKMSVSVLLAALRSLSRSQIKCFTIGKWLDENA